MVTINIFESGASGSGVQLGGKELLTSDDKEAPQGRADNPPSPGGRSFSSEASSAGAAPSPSDGGGHTSFTSSDAPAPSPSDGGGHTSFTSADAPAPSMGATLRDQDNFAPAPSDLGGAPFSGAAGLGGTETSMPTPDDQILPASDQTSTVKRDSKNK